MTTKPEPGNKGKFDLADISLRALQVFVAIEETGSMTQAATRIGLSRSAVSQHVANLENALGVPLFDRAARPLNLTPVGHVLRRHARRVLETISEARTELMEVSLTSLAGLRLGIIDDLDTSITPELMTHLRERFPKAQLSVTSGRSDYLVDQFENRGADIILSGLLPSGKVGYIDFPILCEPFMIVAPPGLLDGGRDLRGQIEDLPYIQYNAGMPIGRAISQQLRRLRIELSSLASFESSRSVFAMARKAGGWAITTPLCLLDSRADLGHLDCYRLPFAGFSRTIRLIARSEELGHLPASLSQLARQLLTQRLREELTTLPSWIGAETVILGDDGAPLLQVPASAPVQAEC